MSLRCEQITVDAANPHTLAVWWAEALDWIIVSEELYEESEEVEIREAMDVFPGLLFLAVPEAKAGKNRLHLDLRPNDHDAEVERLLALGARHVNIGQGEQSWVVLADPEGNEFCVLSSRGD
jgi:hypothetical protein